LRSFIDHGCLPSPSPNRTIYCRVIAWRFHPSCRECVCQRLIQRQSRNQRCGSEFYQSARSTSSWRPRYPSGIPSCKRRSARCQFGVCRSLKAPAGGSPRHVRAAVTQVRNRVGLRGFFQAPVRRQVSSGHALTGASGVTRNAIRTSLRCLYRSCEPRRKKTKHSGLQSDIRFSTVHPAKRYAVTPGWLCPPGEMAPCRRVRVGRLVSFCRSTTLSAR
jgi:hypothetical protein